MTSKKVDIRPGVAILGILQHLKYKPWFALAEFVDNSVQSYFANRKQLDKLSKRTPRLTVSISLDRDGTDATLRVRDNAAGIARTEYAKAFRPAALPTDRSGLSEFGMGMKSAACWFSPYWSVRTSALGESVVKEIKFDLAKIVNDEIEELTFTETEALPTDHFTEVVLRRLHHPPTGRTIGKIKQHLSDIFRCFTRDGALELKFDGEQLTYEPPRILTAPPDWDIKAPAVEWRKDIAFDFGRNMRVHGFAAIRETASTSRAGFALFRRNRLIQGSGDEGYRPPIIFGAPNTYVYQRLFGELHLEGIEVSHTKDGLQWDESEESFLDLLKEFLDAPPISLLKQARRYRTRRAEPTAFALAGQALEATVHDLAASQHIQTQFESATTHVDAGTAEPPPALEEAPPSHTRQFTLRQGSDEWTVIVEITNDPAVVEWLEVARRTEINGGSGSKQLHLRLSMTSPFMRRFCGVNADELEPILRIAVAIGLGEELARLGGARMPGLVRKNVNILLNQVLAEAEHA